MQLSFHGAAGCVTGSKYLVTTSSARILIDCGIFQGPKRLRRLNWTGPDFDPALLDAVILTHAHIDHVGYLPRLVKRGFRGQVFVTAPTGDLVAVSLIDAAHLQEEDAAWRNKKKLSRHKKALPLFTHEDAEAALKLLVPKPYGEWVATGRGLKFRFHVAGHVLGAAGIEVKGMEGDHETTLFFSGDVGRYGNPLTRNPEPPPECDYLICESTYGARIHEPEDPRGTFINLINEIVEQRRVLLIPAFAVSRTQQIVYLINELIRHKLIPSIDIHVDSPMAVSATDIYCKYHDFHSVDLERFGGGDCVLNGRNVTLHRDRKSSKKLNDLTGPAVILSSSGMLTGGRIMHHLIHRLPDPETTIALVGFMAEGTPGRRLAEGATELSVHKQLIKVKAKVISLHGLSGHADFYEMLHWLEPLERAPKKVFITHGESSQSEAMAAHLKEERNWVCYIPKMDETVTLQP